MERGRRTPEQIENSRRQEWRYRYPVPIYVMWASDVPDAEAQAGLQGVADAVRASGQRREIMNFGSSRWGGNGFSSADWYVEEAIRRGGLRTNPFFGGSQLVTGSIGALFYEEPWQSDPHWEVMIINRDLTTGGRDNNFVFGATLEAFPYSVQSVYRLIREIPDVETRMKVIRRVLGHEVGHMFGLAPYGRRNTEDYLGTHCSSICTMKQGRSTDEWITLVGRQESAGVRYCNDCMDDFARARVHIEPLPRTTGIITL